jgi:N-acetyl sugar amidotransferase
MSQAKQPAVIREGEPGYRRCVCCVMDTTDPLIMFDAAGRCSHCQGVEAVLRRWKPEGDPLALEALVERIRRDGRGRDYDAISGLSGGVDSTYLAYLAKQWGLRVLIVHVDTGWNSELAVKNIENAVTRLGFDLATHVVDWEEMQDLQLAFFRSGVPNQDIPQDHAIVAGFYRFAAQHGVRWALSGTNIACECILPTAWGYDNRDVTHIRHIHRRFGRRPLRNYPLLTAGRFTIQNGLLNQMGSASPLNLVRYVKAEAMGVLERELGWRYYGGKHYESRFTKFFQAFYLPQRWGYDKRLAHLSSLVATGQLGRDDALRELRETALPQAELAADKGYLANKLGITDAEFEALLTMPCIPHSAYKQMAPWERRFWNTAMRVVRRIRRS